MPKSRQVIQRHVSIIEKQPDIIESDTSESIENLPPPKVILEYMREIRALGVLQHENIVIMHGVLLKPRLCVVLEHMDNKNLYQYISDKDWQVYVNAYIYVSVLCFIFTFCT
jgi:hypothetical protein